MLSAGATGAGGPYKTGGTVTVVLVPDGLVVVTLVLTGSTTSTIAGLGLSAAIACDSVIGSGRSGGVQVGNPGSAVLTGAAAVTTGCGCTKGLAGIVAAGISAAGAGGPYKTGGVVVVSR